MRLSEGLHPEMLYISKGDKITGIQGAQKAFNSKLESDIQSGRPEKIKELEKLEKEYQEYKASRNKKQKKAA